MAHGNVGSRHDLKRTSEAVKYGGDASRGAARTSPTRRPKQGKTDAWN
jgi:hypothetical protein